MPFSALFAQQSFFFIIAELLFDLVKNIFFKVLNILLMSFGVKFASENTHKPGVQLISLESARSIAF